METFSVTCKLFPCSCVWVSLIFRPSQGPYPSKADDNSLPSYALLEDKHVEKLSVTHWDTVLTSHLEDHGDSLPS